MSEPVTNILDNNLCTYENLYVRTLLCCPQPFLCTAGEREVVFIVSISLASRTHELEQSTAGSGT